MTLTELINAVYVETARPDMVAETLQAVQEATLTVHNTESYFNDIHESLVIFDAPTQYIQQLDTNALPRYRGMVYIRKTSSVINPIEQYGLPFNNYGNLPANAWDFLTACSVDNVIDSYGYEKQDIWYQAGRQINMKSSTAIAQVMCGFYQNPLVGSTDATFDSWIADTQPYAIVYRAAGTIYAKTGDTANYAIYMKPPIPGKDQDTGGMYYQQLNLLTQNNLVAGA